MNESLRIAPGIAIPATELRYRFVQASGPGGQNVNKVATAVELRFDLAASPSLPHGLKHRARHLAGTRLNSAGEICIRADRFRTQAANRTDATRRLLALLQEAAIPPRKRRPTRPTRASNRRRLDAKKHRGNIKAKRGRPLAE